MKDVTTTNVGTQAVFPTPPVKSRSTAGNRQCDRILRLLIEARGSWVPLPEILTLGCAQYGARILELRRLGYKIENKSEWVEGSRHSWFRLVPSPPAGMVTPNPVTASPEWKDRRPATGLPLFDLEPSE